MAALTPEEERKEREDVELLDSMMGGDVNPEEARRVLRKHKGDVNKAAEAILGGDRGEEPVDNTAAWNQISYAGQTQQTNTTPTSTAVAPHVPLASSSTVIDLTSDDDEYSRALQLSMETISSQTETKFGPSERAPDPAWQMVPSNVNQFFLNSNNQRGSFC